MKPKKGEQVKEETHTQTDYAKSEEASTDFECACFTCPSQEACKAAQEAQPALVEDRLLERRDRTAVQGFRGL